MEARTNASGVELRSSKLGVESIRIGFMYRGMYCRETLKLPHTKQNINYAVRLRAEILNAIERNSFQYGTFFPNSKLALKFGHVPESKIKIGKLLTDYLVKAEKTLAHSTFVNYEQSYKYYLKAQFENVLITELKPADLREWIESLGFKAKTIKNILTPVRQVIEQAINDDIIQNNPLDRVMLKKTISREQFESEFEIDPFSIEEIYRILEKCEDQQARNMWQFAFATGLRISEYIALEWGTIDWVNYTVPVLKVRVEGESSRRTKTVSGRRNVDMLNAAYVALKNQEKYTKMKGDLVFPNENMIEGYWNSRKLGQHWKRLLLRAGVRHRNPYQTRHTFASTLLSEGANPLYVANQMGHKTTEMINRNYGRWINQGNSPEARKLIREFYGKAVDVENFPHVSPKISGIG